MYSIKTFGIFCTRVLRVFEILGIFKMLRIFVSIRREKIRRVNLLNLLKGELFLPGNNLGTNKINIIKLIC